MWSPRSRPLQEADRDIGHIPGVRKARREPNRDLRVFSLSLSCSFSVWPLLLSVLPFLLNISAARGPPRTTLVAWRNIQYPSRIPVAGMKPKETDSGSIEAASKTIRFMPLYRHFTAILSSSITPHYTTISFHFHQFLTIAIFHSSTAHSRLM